MDTAQKRDAEIVEMFGNRFVGRQQEFFNDLMADVMLDEMGAGDAALLVKFQLGFRHVQLDGPALEPPPAQAHGKVARVEQQGENLWFNLTALAFGILK